MSDLSLRFDSFVRIRVLRSHSIHLYNHTAHSCSFLSHCVEVSSSYSIEHIVLDSEE